MVSSAYLHNMDDKWFKHRQKIAGVTAEDIAQEMGRDRSVVSRIYVGRQPMTPDQAKVFARVLEVPLSEVLERAGVLSAGEAQVAVPGFSAGDVAPYQPKPSEQAASVTPARAFGGDKPGVDVWRVSTRAMQNGGFMPGDFILVDTHQAERCVAGDVVIAQQYNWQADAATTLLRRFEPPVLVAASPDVDDGRVQVVDGSNVVIMGKVIACWRVTSRFA